MQEGSAVIDLAARKILSAGEEDACIRNVGVYEPVVGMEGKPATDSGWEILFTHSG